MNKKFRVYQTITQFGITVKARNRKEAIAKAKEKDVEYKWEEYDLTEDAIGYDAVQLR